MDLFGTPPPMRALSWKQPFGTAMLFGKHETRVWSTPYRGKVLICTSKAAYDEASVRKICGEENFIRLCQVMNKDSGTLDLNGYAIAVGELTACRAMKPGIEEEKTFVKYKEGLYVHVYENVRPIKPFAWKGAQGWKKVPAEIIAQIEFP